MHYLSQNKVIQFSFKNIFHDFALVCVLKRSVFHLKSNWAMRMRVSVCECVCVCVWVRVSACECVSKLANWLISIAHLSVCWVAYDFFPHMSDTYSFLSNNYDQHPSTSPKFQFFSLSVKQTIECHWRKGFFYLKTTVAEICQ